MFKVSLLPNSYKKFLEGKKKKDLVQKIAVLILLCLLIIYAGFGIKSVILKSQYKKISAKNNAISQQVSELQQYKTIYDSLALAKQRVDTIKPTSPTALKFYTLVKNNRPEYIKIQGIALTNWANEAICTIEGELPAAFSLANAIEQLESYSKSFTENEAYGGVVKAVRVVNDGLPEMEREGLNIKYKFRIFVSLSGTINIDETGALVTTTESTTAKPSETQPSQTQATESTQAAGTTASQEQSSATQPNTQEQSSTAGTTASEETSKA